MRSRIRRLRLIEWLCASVILATGLHLLAFPATFDRPSMIGISSIASYGAWTMLLLCVGASRVAHTTPKVPSASATSAALTTT